MLIDLERERKGKGETLMWEHNMHQLPPAYPPPPMGDCAHNLEIKPATSCFLG